MLLQHHKIATRLLIVSLDSLVRASSNPFFPYMLGRIEQGIEAPRARSP